MPATTSLESPHPQPYPKPQILYSKVQCSNLSRPIPFIIEGKGRLKLGHK